MECEKKPLKLFKYVLLERNAHLCTELIIQASGEWPLLRVQKAKTILCIYIYIFVDPKWPNRFWSIRKHCKDGNPKTKHASILAAVPFSSRPFSLAQSYLRFYTFTQGSLLEHCHLYLTDGFSSPFFSIFPITPFLLSSPGHV